MVHGVDYKALTFKMSLAIGKTLDPAGAQSQIPPKVLLVHNICLFYHCSIQDLGTLEMNEVFNELFVDGILKPKHKETKCLTHILHMLKDFQVKWIKFILN